jgi:hypothetical protein
MQGFGQSVYQEFFGREKNEEREDLSSPLTFGAANYKPRH